MAAFEGYDMAALTALLHEDAVMTMPPFDLWLRGTTDITGFMTTLGAACAGSRLVPVAGQRPAGLRPVQAGPGGGAVSLPGRSRSWRSQTAGSPGSTSSSTRSAGSRSSASPLHLEAEADEIE